MNVCGSLARFVDIHGYPQNFITVKIGGREWAYL